LKKFQQAFKLLQNFDILNMRGSMLEVKLRKHFHINKEFQLEYYNEPYSLEIEYKLTKKEENSLLKLLNDKNNILNSIPKEKISIKVSENKYNFFPLFKDESEDFLFNIKKGNTCSKCYIDINITGCTPQYYCYWCNIYFCKKCGSTFNSTKTGLDALPHNHNLIYINVKKETKAMKGISISLLKEYREKLMYNSNVCRCNSCKDLQFTILYKCLLCKYDREYNNIKAFCEYDHLKFDRDPYFNGLNFANKHDPKTHIYIVYSYGSTLFE